ncbi:18365_t:CDS:2 [Funneliformis geosporum]|uniref:15685_t:CDS:1 n=1 Tax=Funneliformis geosporum TaxID=1117311 RepID=A0A9W4WPY5_9GLOM|nr:15685_t:CDS:2 [Funneliformis geosporum]CAI2189905.1 18365_t:CDS:2 [Funneliformis geosporum]
MGVEDERGDRGQTRKIVNFVLQQENIDPRRQGSSGGSAIYLALLSVLHQKPISHSVAATGNLIMSEQKGMVNGREILLASGTNLPIAGLEEKVAACAEKGLNRLVLSKYQTAPLLSS